MHGNITREMNMDMDYILDGVKTDKWPEYTTTLSTKAKIEQMEQWLIERNFEYNYIGYMSDMQEKFEAHWHIPNEQERMLFIVAFGKGKLD